MKRNKICMFLLVFTFFICFNLFYITFYSRISNDKDLLDLKISDPSPVWIHDPGATPRDIAISNDGNYIICGSLGSFDGDIHLFHRSSSTPLWSKDLDDAVFEVDISADGSYIVASGGDNNLYLFHRNSSTPIWNLTFGDYGFYTCAISDDGFWIAAGHSNGNLYMLNRTSSTPMWSHHYLSDIKHIDMSADGELFAVQYGNAYVHLYNRSDSNPVNYFNTYANIHEIDLSEDGKWLVLTDYDNRLRLYNTSNSQAVWSNSQNVWRASISADGQYIVAGQSFLYFYDRTNSTPIWSYNASLNIYDVKISADGTSIAAGTGTSLGTDGVFFFDSFNSEPLWFSAAGVSQTRCMAISSDGSYLAVGDGANDAVSQIILFYQDKIPPTWDSPPIDQIVEYGTNFSYDVNASDLSGIAYYWINNTINFDIDSNGLITNASSLAIGEYWIEIRAYDQDDNFCSAVINITMMDTTLPIWDSPPIDQIVEFGINFLYDVNASDLSGIAYYWINDTINFDIDSSGLITNATSLNAIEYWVEIRAYDPEDNFCSAIINIGVIDSTPPIWDTNPQDQITEFGMSFSYDVDASDLSGIAYYWINDTINFDIDSNGLITNATFLAIGEYWIEIRAYNPSDNFCSFIINVSVKDSTPPIWDTSPQDQITEFGTSFSYDVDASDLSGIAYYWINDTINFDIDSNGLITNATFLATGEYWIKIRAYDPYDNYCSDIIKMTIKQVRRSPNISGHEITILFSLMGITIVGLITYIRKRQKFNIFRLNH